MTGNKRRYQIFLQSETGAPIDVYLVSQDDRDYTIQEEGPMVVPAEVIIGPNSPKTPKKQAQQLPSIVIPVSPTQTVESNLNPGLLKLSSPHSMDPDYYLNNIYQSEGITDFYTDGM